MTISARAVREVCATGQSRSPSSKERSERGQTDQASDMTRPETRQTPPVAESKEESRGHTCRHAEVSFRFRQYSTYQGRSPSSQYENRLLRAARPCEMREVWSAASDSDALHRAALLTASPAPRRMPYEEAVMSSKSCSEAIRAAWRGASLSAQAPPMVLSIRMLSPHSRTPR